MSVDMSIVVPGIRSDRWSKLREQIIRSCNRHSCEVIFCSSKPLPNELVGLSDVKHILDHGSPARCFQHGSMAAEGEMIALLSDDGVLFEGALSACIDQLRAADQKDLVAMRYTEGQGFRANMSDFVDSYWTAWHHADQRLPGVDPSWRVCMIFMMRRSQFLWLGGVDCAFEHVNMNLHDMAYRAQRAGGRVLLSPSFVAMYDWDPNRNEHNSPVIQAYHRNDLPLFHSIYGDLAIAASRPIQIEYDNWRSSPEVWQRRLSFESVS